MNRAVISNLSGMMGVKRLHLKNPARFGVAELRPRGESLDELLQTLEHQVSEVRSREQELLRSPQVYYKHSQLALDLKKTGEVLESLPFPDYVQRHDLRAVRGLNTLSRQQQLYRQWFGSFLTGRVFPSLVQGGYSQQSNRVLGESKKVLSSQTVDYGFLRSLVPTLAKIEGSARTRPDSVTNTLCQYLYPRYFTVNVYGSARTKPGTERWQKDFELGQALARAGYSVFSGAGPGTMTAVSKGLLAARKAAMKMGVELPVHAGGAALDLPNEATDRGIFEELYLKENFPARIARFNQRGFHNFFRVGGWGTLREFVDFLEDLHFKFVDYPTSPYLVVIEPEKNKVLRRLLNKMFKVITYNLKTGGPERKLVLKFADSPEDALFWANKALREPETWVIPKYYADTCRRSDSASGQCGDTFANLPRIMTTWSQNRPSAPETSFNSSSDRLDRFAGTQGEHQFVPPAQTLRASL